MLFSIIDNEQVSIIERNIYVWTVEQVILSYFISLINVIQTGLMLRMRDGGNV